MVGISILCRAGCGGSREYETLQDAEGGGRRAKGEGHDRRLQRKVTRRGSLKQTVAYDLQTHN